MWAEGDRYGVGDCPDPHLSLSAVTLQKAKSGMLMYEQDWLDTEYDGLAAFGT